MILNIIIILFAITMIHYWLNCSDQCVEKYTNQSNEAVQNIAEVYQTKDMVLNNVTITGNLSVKGDTNIDNNLNVANLTTSKSLQVNNDTTLIAPGDNPLLLRSTGGNPKVQFFKNSTQQGWTGIGIDGNLWVQSTTPQGVVLTVPKLYKQYDGLRLIDGNDIAGYNNFVAANATDCVSRCGFAGGARSALYRKSDSKCYCKTSINVYNNPDPDYFSAILI